MHETTVIATRESRLAMWQAEHVRDRLKLLYPQCMLTAEARGPASAPEALGLQVADQLRAQGAEDILAA